MTKAKQTNRVKSRATNGKPTRALSLTKEELWTLHLCVSTMMKSNISFSGDNKEGDQELFERTLVDLKWKLQKVIGIENANT